METLYSTKTLQKLSSNGKRRYWRGHVVQKPNGDVGHRSEYWGQKKDGTDGKHQFSKPVVVEKKNVGRANETTLQEQARLEIDSKYESKLDKRRYWPVGEEQPDFRAMPMSAKTYGKIESSEFKAEDADKVEFPALAQPKLDGVRMLYDGDKGWSRNLKIFGEHCWDRLPDLPDGIHLDGELMTSGTFQNTVSAVTGASGIPEFHVFDIFDSENPEMPFEERLRMLRDLANEHDLNIVPTRVVESHQSLLDLHSELVADGYEGTMVRNKSGTYKDSTTRSSDLFKLKGFMEDEFEIVDVGEGTGKFEGVPVFVCVTAESSRFEVCPVGTDDDRTRMFEDREKLVGKMLTVRFQGWTDDGIPRIATAITIRDFYE